MEIAACKAISELVPEDELKDDYIIPSIFNEQVSDVICEAIKNLNHEQK